MTETGQECACADCQSLFHRVQFEGSGSNPPPKRNGDEKLRVAVPVGWDEAGYTPLSSERLTALVGLCVVCFAVDVRHGRVMRRDRGRQAGLFVAWDSAIAGMPQTRWEMEKDVKFDVSPEHPGVSQKFMATRYGHIVALYENDTVAEVNWHDMGVRAPGSLGYPPRMVPLSMLAVS